MKDLYSKIESLLSTSVVDLPKTHGFDSASMEIILDKIVNEERVQGYLWQKMVVMDFEPNDVIEIQIKECKLSDTLEDSYLTVTHEVGRCYENRRLFAAIAHLNNNNMNISRQMYMGSITLECLRDIANYYSALDVSKIDMFIDESVWRDIIGDSQFAAALHPVAKTELVMSGHLGHMECFGAVFNMYTDAFEHPDARFMQTNCVFGPSGKWGVCRNHFEMRCTPIGKSVRFDREYRFDFDKNIVTVKFNK